MNELRNKIRVGITIGDPAGIGPAITAMAVAKLKNLADFVVIGDSWVFEKNQKPKINPSTTLRVDGEQGRTIKNQNFKFIDLNNVNHKNFSFGRVRAEYGRASMEYLDKALALIKRGEIDCLVTCPISKEAVNLAGIKFSGHTEYLARRAKTKDVVMMLVNKEMRFSLVTRHIPLKKVSPALKKDNLSKTISITHHFLKKFFSIKEPRIVVCGVNPHASDNGILGDEENKIIQPVIKKLKKFIKHLHGPLSADVAIYKAKQKKYDCVIAMYHDQALIPLKLLNRDQGVNITLGLPFVRTSPLHGTAFDIAGTSIANPSSLIEAIKLAVKCTLNQRKD